MTRILRKQIMAAKVKRRLEVIDSTKPVSASTLLLRQADIVRRIPIGGKGGSRRKRFAWALEVSAAYLDSRADKACIKRYIQIP